MVVCARAQQAAADAAQLLQPQVASAPAPGQAFARWRSPRMSPSFLFVMDSRYLQLSWALDGYRRSRVPLVAYEQGKFLAAGFADDPGIYFFIPIMSSALHLSLPRSIDLFLGCIIAIGFGVGATGVLRFTKTVTGRVLAITLLVCLLFLTVLIGDVYVVQSSFALAVIPWGAFLTGPAGLGRRAIVLAFILGISGYVINTIRTHAGTVPLMFIAIIIFGMHERAVKKIIFALAATLGFVLAMGVFNIVIHQRNTYLAAKDRTYHPVIAHHPMWHTIYAGLGFLQNDYGMKYDDSVPIAKVHSVDPHAEYLSPEYERVLEREVLSFTAAHPAFVAGTLAVKLGVLLFTFLICANLGLIATVRYVKPWPIETAFAVGLVFTSLPSVLAVPHISYMLGYIAFGILYGIISLEYGLQRRRTHVSTDVNSILDSYPCKRPPITGAHEACFVAGYRRNRAGKKGLNGVVAHLESWMHKTIASTIGQDRILELGAEI